MTKLQIIAKLWSAVYDLVFLVKETPTKTLEQIESDLDVIEYACQKYVDCDDDEIAIFTFQYVSIISTKTLDYGSSKGAFTFQYVSIIS